MKKDLCAIPEGTVRIYCTCDKKVKDVSNRCTCSIISFGYETGKEKELGGCQSIPVLELYDRQRKYPSKKERIQREYDRDFTGQDEESRRFG